MADARKTYAELVIQDTVEDTDLFASFRGSGPLKQLEATALLAYTQTGVAGAAVTLGFAGSEARTIVERFESDPANLLDYYDATDGADYSPALTRACAAKFAVYVPAGTYPLLDKVTMDTLGNFIFGDGVAESIFAIDSATFDMAATAVIECPTTASENHAGLTNIGFTFVQPDTSVRASFNQYPYAFKARGVARMLIGNIRITGGYNGLDLRDNTGGLMGGRWELGCVNENLTIGGCTGGTAALDFWHVDTIHVWPFGFQDGATRLLAWSDGSTIAARFGRVDGLDIKTFSTFTARIITEGTSGEGLFGTITSLQLDGKYSRLEHDFGKLEVGSGYSTSSLNNDYAIKLTSANAKIDVAAFRASGAGGGSQALFDAGAGSMSLAAVTCQVSSTYPAASVNGGLLSYSSGIIAGITNTTRTVPAILQTSGSLSLGNILFEPLGAGSGAGVTFTTDDRNNYIDPGIMGGWTLALPTAPSGGYLGSYGQVIPVYRSIAAADPLPLLSTDSVVVVTGNTSFGTIQRTRPGHKVTLLFTGTPTLSNNPGVNEFAGQSSILAYDGLSLELTMNTTNWEETGRTNTNAALGWVATTPTVTSTAGAFTTVAAALSSRVALFGSVEFSLTITVTDAGTAAGAMLVSLPYASVTREAFAGMRADTNAGVCANLDAGGSQLNIALSTGAFAGATGAVIVISGRYRANV